MSKNRTNLVGTLIAVGALGATAGMFAWRWSQRHRRQRSSYHRELNRWEGEGGALASNGNGPVEVATSAASGGGEIPGASVAAAPGHSNGAAGTPWPFPHGQA